MRRTIAPVAITGTDWECGMTRVSERIEHHARKAAFRVRDAGRRVRGGAWLLVLVAAVIALVILAYFSERSAAQAQDITRPLPCAQLRFSGNRALCERTLHATFEALPIAERTPLCSGDRARFGSAATLCDEYDETSTAHLRNASLAERGISVWELEPVRISGALRVRVVGEASSVRLVCDETVVPTTFSRAGQDLLLTFESPPGERESCVLIAVTPQGSVTSEAFGLQTA